MLKTLMVGTTLLAFAWSISVAAYAIADSPKQINVPAGDLVTALETLARQADISVVYQAHELAGLRTGGVTGSLTPQEAVTKLLRGTKLHLRTDPTTGAMLIEPPHTNALARTGEGPAQGGTEAATDARTAANDAGRGDAKRSFWDRFRVAQVDQGTSSGSTPVEKQTQQTSKEKPLLLEEVLVTAQKREERLQDVPVPVTAISGDTLVESNKLRLQDYYTSIPGLSVTPRVLSGQILSIRGITTGGSTNPTVGITVDDMPYGSSTALAGGLVVPDIDPGDLARVEVLRGPQGTLYGASSMGGLLKFVTVDPSTAGVSGRMQAGVSSVYNGAERGYNVRGSVNVPLSDTLAARASGFTRQDPGYIDNPILHIDGVNKERVSGGRLSGLWRPSDAISLKISALYQDTRGDGSNDVDVPTAGYPQTTGLGDLQQNYLRGIGAYDRKVQAYSAILTAKVGSVDLTAVSGYNINTMADSWDYTYLLGGFTQFLFGVAGSPVFDENNSRKFTQEIRLSTPVGERVEWLFGAFYTHENSSFEENSLAVNPATGVSAGVSLHYITDHTYAEYAAFSDLTFHVVDRFDIQIGGRESQIRQTYAETDSGPFAPFFFGQPSPIVIPEVDTKGNAFTYLVTPRIKVSSDLMVYARLASGYRAGGPNPSPGGVVPRQYNPDKTQNYEVGAKGDFLDHSLSVDASLYYIDWKDIQLFAVNPRTQFGYDFNGSRAKSQGMELSIESRPLSGLKIAGWVALTDAALTEDFPPTSSARGKSGDRLPYSSRFSGNFSVDQEFPLWSAVTGFVGGLVSYVGDRKSVFTGAPTAPLRQDLPAYARADLRAGAKYDSWTVNLFVTNVADKRGFVAGGLGEVPPFGFTYIQPRTVGLSVIKIF